MSKPIIFRSQREVRWAKEWIEHQIKDGRMSSLLLKRLPMVEDAEGFNSTFASELRFDARSRLQKSLSARRARYQANQRDRTSSPAVRKVKMEVTEDVRTKVQRLADSRGMTTSELLDSYIDDDFSRLPL